MTSFATHQLFARMQRNAGSTLARTAARSRKEGYICSSCLHRQRRYLANLRESSPVDGVKITSTGLRRDLNHGLDSPNVHNSSEIRPDPRTLQLGKTVSILHDRLPTLLASPLPSEILSPQITLHLFPSTHPHLPTVSGRIAYLAALWTAPVAWGRVPVLGNIRLVILSERMVKNGCGDAKFRNEKLIVRWRTCGKTKGRGVGGLYKGIGGGGDQVDKITEFLGGDTADDQSEFTGLFVFEFDEEGRIQKHVIEHAQEGGNLERMTRVVSVTDWLIGLAKGKSGHEGGPGIGVLRDGSKGFQAILEGEATWWRRCLKW